MATVLFVGGVSPDVTQDDLLKAFSQQTTLLASSVVRSQTDGRCIGQAYVTVTTDDVPKAIAVTEVGGNSVCVFPVDVEAWVAPPRQGLNNPPVAASAAGGGTGWFSGSGNLGTPPDTLGGLPSTSHPNLQLVLDQLRACLSSQPRLAFNGKPYYMLLHECCQKRQMGLQVSETAEGVAFVSTINISTALGAIVCTGRGGGSSKKDAKHNAAAACLDRLLAIGQVSPMELVAAMTCHAAAPNPSMASGLGPDGGFGGAGSPAAASAVAQTQNIMRLGLYPRCEEVMRQLHSTELGRVKTLLMVINEYAGRNRMTILHDEVNLQAGGSQAANFRYISRLLDTNGNLLAQATSVELRSKQEAKQSSAAALIEHLLVHNLVTAEAIVRGR